MGRKTMKRSMLFVVLLLVLPTLACSFSLDMGGETPEATTAPLPTDEGVEPSPTLPPTQELPTPVPPTPTLPPISGPGFYDVGFTSEVTDDGAPVGIAQRFPSGTTLVYSFASYDGMTDGLECESVWYQDGQESLRSPFTWSLGESSGALWISNLSNENGLIPAQYDWELYVDGDLVATGSFVVGGEALSPTLFEDDFSDSSSGWVVGTTDEGSVGYRDGVYSVTSTENATPVWGMANQSFSDLIIDVDTTQASAPSNDNNAYGVMCRMQPNGTDGYALRISGDGWCSIHKVTDGQFEALVDWTASDAIQQGNASNHLRVVCDRADLALFVNGELVAEATDTTFVEGDIALTATTFEDEPTEVLFDNLVATGP
jgi:hypothetical protein